MKVLSLFPQSAESGARMSSQRSDGPPDFEALLGELARDPEAGAQLAHVERLAARPARYAEPLRPLAPELAEALAEQGVERLYLHQARAVDLARAGGSLCVVTGTASGKTLCYNLPVLERLLADADATALYLFPTKALAQDQLRSLARLIAAAPARGAGGRPGPAAAVRFGVYDGDTSQNARRKLRETANLVLSNPDMLHQGILPYHAKWARLLGGLRFVVVDEMHAYRGVFGSHVALVLRRLRRLCRHYGSDPVFLLCSATVRNPGEHAAALLGAPVTVVDEDGAPRGPRLVAFWNPRLHGPGGAERRSSNVEGMRLFTACLRAGAQAILFTKARVVAELIYRYAREQLKQQAPALADRIRPYRAGFLPEERRAIERALFSGELRGVVSTNALELGIDVGSLDASVLVGFPPTVASTWQQVGRAGRQGHPALALVVAYDDPVDQYLMRHPEYFFGKSPEAAVIDPANPYLLSSHLACAAYELPLAPLDREVFGAATGPVAEALEEDGQLRTLDGRGYWASADFPAAHVSLRTMSDDTFTIVDATRANAVVGTVDAISAPELVYPGAIYLHEGASYFVRKLDLEQKTAEVEPRVVEYYTQPVLDTNLLVRGETRRREVCGEPLTLGPATVSWATVGMKKIRFYTLESIGYRPLDLPRLKLETVAAWLAPSRPLRRRLAARGLKPVEALAGVRNLAVTVLPLLAMCEPEDVGGVVDHKNLGQPALFLYDRYPGGLGFCEQAFHRFEELLAACRRMVAECPCESGCPSCVGLPVLRPPQQQDPDLGSGWPMPSKEAAHALLVEMLGDDGGAHCPEGRR
jgi:DEAD/DEAH box helicase domain-containing protein